MFELTPFVKHGMTYDPFRELEEMQKKVFGSASFVTDIKDAGDKYIVEAELPGFKKEDIDISVENDVLTVTAAHSENTEEKKGDKYVRRERRYGSYSRSFDVSEVESDGITASLENGVLTLNLPKKAEKTTASRKIELQ